MPSGQPTNWKEENEALYNQLVNYFGGDSTDIDSLPYLYIGGESNNWTGEDKGMGMFLKPTNLGSYDKTQFFSSYSSLLKEDGYSNQEGTTHIFIKGTIKVTVSPSDVLLMLSKYEESTPTTPPSKVPTNWKEENPNIFNELVKLYGDETIVNALPYLSKQSLANKWVMTNDFASGFGVIVKYVGEDYASIATDYENLLTENKFSKGANNVFTKDTVSIRFAQDNTKKSFIVQFNKATAGGGETTPSPEPQPNLPQSWQEDNPAVYTELSQLYGSNASTIPYLGWEGISNNWKVTTTAQSTGNLASVIEAPAGDDVARQFYAQYGAFLINSGGYQGMSHGQGYRKAPNMLIKFNVDDNGNIKYNGKVVIYFYNNG